MNGRRRYDLPSKAPLPERSPAAQEHRLEAPPRRRSPARGQSLTEFAIFAPVMLALLGITLDFARVYHAWINLESATRDAAQYLATSASDPLDENHSGTNPDGKAKYILELTTGASFAIAEDQTNCTSPMMSVSYAESTNPAAGGSEAYPVGTGVVKACLPFRALFSYPLLTDDGNWVLHSERTYRVVVGR
jgi:hypothetical protein